MLSDVSDLYAEIDRLRRKNKQLSLQVKHLKRRLSQCGFCPDCRDKVDGTCFRCKYQAATKEV